MVIYVPLTLTQLRQCAQTQLRQCAHYAHNNKSTYTHRDFLERYKTIKELEKKKKKKRERCTFLILKLVVQYVIG